MFIGGGIGPFKHPPVHECLTLAALIRSDFKLDPNTTYNKAIQEYHYDTLEFLRGIVWNDDPACLLFNDTWWLAKPDNYHRGIGRDWAVQFADGKIWDADCTKEGWLGHKNIIARSHFGDMQFLHAMADHVDERPAETKKKIMTWLEVMYKIAIGKISIATKLRDVELAGEEEHDRYPLRRLFDAGTRPADWMTIHTLLTHDHSYPNVKHDRRAIGICLHLVQDSYARGHCQREILKSEDPKRFGRILNFHSFRGQDEEAHKKYDFGDREMDDADCSDLDQFNDMDGCIDAIEQCSKLINSWYRQTPWEEVHTWLQDEVFEVSPEATPSNTNVE